VKVWVVSCGEPLVHFDERARPQRVGLLTRYLRQRGHDVTWWTSTFDHYAHRQYVSGDAEVTMESGVRLKTLATRGYASNVSVARILDHVQLAVRFRDAAQRAPAPDIIIASMPPIELAAEAMRLADKLGIPGLIDIRDLWPEAIRELAPGWMRPFMAIPEAAWSRVLVRGLRHATGILALSDGYLGWALQRAARPRRSTDGVFSVTYPDTDPGSDLEADRMLWRRFGVTADAGWLNCCFFGGLGETCELDGVLDVASDPIVRNLPIRFVLCGDGQRLARLRQRSAMLSNVVLPGRVSFSAIRALASISAIGIAPYRPIENYRLGIPNKAVEYMALGLAMLWGVPTGELADLIQQRCCGRAFDSSRPATLRDALLDLVSDRDQLAIAREKARALFGERFAEREVMTRYCEHIERWSGAVPAN
jgi:hypothetical protein